YDLGAVGHSAIFVLDKISAVDDVSKTAIGAQITIIYRPKSGMILNCFPDADNASRKPSKKTVIIAAAAHIREWGNRFVDHITFYR
ncbi:MAG: hypothetical protein ACM3Y8_10305, partial [Byssovorax cruenta]